MCPYFARSHSTIDCGLPETHGPPGAGPGATNRRIEHEVTALGGHKSLYSESFYDEEEFRRLYGGEQYTALKQRWDPDGRLPDLYAKAVRGA